MAGLLSRITRSNQAESRVSATSTPFVPIGAGDLARRAELLESFENSGIGWFWASDAEGRIIYLSKAAISRLNATEQDVIGRNVTDLFDQDPNEEGCERPLKFQLAARNTMAEVVVKLRVSDTEAWWELSGKPQFDEGGQFAGYHGSAKDISGTIEARRDAERLSQFDSLTGLANRYRMARQLDSTLTSFRASKRSCALMMMDLDRFKQVNDTIGHQAGDEVLKQVAARLKRIIGERGEIGRLGGDEFQMIFPDIDDRGELGDFAQRVIQMVSQPYSVDGNRAIIGASIGVAVAPYDGIDTEELVKATDLALYAAKTGGRAQHRFYSTDLRDNATYRHQIEDELRDAIVKGELQMHYQPIVDATTHEVACMEALMRWEHPERGMISPADFIPIAEETGLIREMGEWALNQVCRDVTSWPGKIKAAVNVSAVQFASDDFVEIVERALKSSGVDPTQIELEITESVFVGDIERTLRLFKELKNLDVRLSLDDFGTGYSSLSYLRDAPFDKVKIDQSFVRGCSATENNNLAIVAAVVGLAKALNMETVAEGVETQDELKLVTEQGASHLQGIIFSRAVPIDEVLAKFEQGDLVYVPRGPEKYRSDRRTEFRKIGLIHGDHRYTVFLRNLSKTGAKIEGLLGVAVGTDVVLDLGGGQLAVATVRRSEGHSQGVEFETPLINNGSDGLCTRHRVSPYQIEMAGRPLRALGDDAYSAMMQQAPTAQRAFVEVQVA